MKKIVFVLIALVTFNTQAQKGEMHRESMRDLTTEQFATLKTKKMTLHLELNQKQQKAISKLNLKLAKKHSKIKKEYRKEMTSDERFKMKNEMLDNQIEVQQEMKNILTDEQFSKWKENSERKKHKIKKRGKRKLERKRMRRMERN